MTNHPSRKATSLRHSSCNIFLICNKNHTLPCFDFGNEPSKFILSTLKAKRELVMGVMFLREADSIQLAVGKHCLVDYVFSISDDIFGH